MRATKIVTILLLWAGVTLAFIEYGSTQELTGNVDSLDQIINLVVESNPILQSQRRLVKQIEDLPDPGRGFDLQLSLNGEMGTRRDESTGELRITPAAGVSLEIPLFNSSRRRELIKDQLTYFKELEKARQDYFDLKSSIISELLSKINELRDIRSEKEKLQKLRLFLNSNVESLRQQVKSGLIKPTELWELTERIMDTETKIQNLSTELSALRREIVINFGGERSKELGGMLEVLSLEQVGGDNLESR